MRLDKGARLIPTRFITHILTNTTNCLTRCQSLVYNLLDETPQVTLRHVL